MKIAYWQEDDGKWLGYLEKYPGFLTQGRTLNELKENLKDIFSTVRSPAFRRQLPQRQDLPPKGGTPNSMLFD